MTLRPWHASLLAALLVCCSTSQPAPSTAPSASAVPAPAIATTTPSPTAAPAGACANDCWPLSGRPLAGGDPKRRPILAKIDNHPLARPHYGINQADLVFETIVEGYATRLAAIFQSQDPKTIAAIRSARLTDRSLAPMVRGALVYSGTSAFEKPLIQQDARDGKYLDLSADYYSQYQRFPDRPGPYNMYTSTTDMRAIVKQLDPKPVDVPRWAFLSGAHTPQDGGMTGALPAVELTVPYREDVALVTYKYDAAARTYARWQNISSKPAQTVDALDGKPVAATNVVVLYTDIVDVPEIVDAAGFTSFNMRLTGTGAASVFRDGLRLDASWSRANDNAPFAFASGTTPILLAAGQTWIEVIPIGWVVSSK